MKKIITAYLFLMATTCLGSCGCHHVEPTAKKKFFQAGTVKFVLSKAGKYKIYANVWSAYNTNKFLHTV